MVTEEDLFKILDEEHHQTVKRWLDRGDGVAVYRNMAMDSANCGHRKFLSFGSKQCQLEPKDLVDGQPPQRLPDIGSQINWQYQLEATVRREERHED